MKVTESGMLIAFRALQWAKAYPPTKVTELGIVTVSNLQQSKKVQLGIFVMESGMTIDVNCMQKEKAHKSMSLTVCVIS